jgi:uncharacterized protein
MMSVQLIPIVVVTLTFVLAGFVKGVTGMGLPTVAMGLLGIIMAPVAAASLLIVPSFLTNIFQLFSGPNIIVLFKRFWGMMLGIVCGTILSANFIANDPEGLASIGLGIALMIYAAAGLSAFRMKIPTSVEPWLSPLVGVATGVTTGMTGVFVFPSVLYIQSLALDRENLIQALGLSFTISTTALAAGLAKNATFDTSRMLASCLALIPAFIGMALGQWLRKKISQETFRIWFFIGLMALGFHLVFSRSLEKLSEGSGSKFSRYLESMPIRRSGAAVPA